MKYIIHFIGVIAGVDTSKPYWWLSQDKQAFLSSTHQ